MQNLKIFFVIERNNIFYTIKIYMKLNSPKKNLVALLKTPEVRSWRTLMVAFQSIYSQLEKDLNSEGISVSRFQILFYLYFEGSHKATELSKKLLVTRANMSMFLKRMESDGMIKFDFPDRQKRPVVEITKSGVIFFESLFPRHIKRVQKLVVPFSKPTLSELKKMADSFGQTRLGKN